MVEAPHSNRPAPQQLAAFHLEHLRLLSIFFALAGGRHVRHHGSRGTMLETLLEIVARFVGITVLALGSWIRSGFRRGYRAEWRRLFEKHSGASEWVDVLGAVALLLCVVGVGWLVYRVVSS